MPKRPTGSAPPPAASPGGGRAGIAPRPTPRPPAPDGSSGAGTVAPGAGPFAAVAAGAASAGEAGPAVDPDAVRTRAYFRYLDRTRDGRHGTHEEDWHAAERDLRIGENGGGD